MSKFIGKNLTVEINGESHSSEISVIVGGLKGFPLYKDDILDTLSRRKASASVFSTKRIEGDEPEFFGVENDTLQDVFKAVVKNNNVKKQDYSSLFGKPRPSHADYAWYLKDGALDFSGGGRFSGRLTAPLCIAGGECLGILKKKGIGIIAYVQSVGKVKGASYKDHRLSLVQIKEYRIGAFPSLSKKEEMLSEISAYASEGNSVGARIECLVYGLNGGVGNDYFDGLEGKISSLIYSVPAVKGVEFGDGFDFCENNGKDANDPLTYKDGKVTTETNRSGGINGGISNGNVITIGVALRPTPSISIVQRTVDLVRKENTQICVKGRHDPCIAPRAIPAIESAVAIAILDEILN